MLFRSKFAYNDKANTLVIGDLNGSYNGMLKSRRFNIVYHRKGQTVANAIDFDNISGTIVKYTGKCMSVKLR